MDRVFVSGPDGRRILITDTITILEPGDAGAIVVSGSHGGISSAQFALGRGLAAAFFNDAGGGRAGAGLRALAALDEAELAAMTYGHDSARIGDGRDAWENGVVTHANLAARRLGGRAGLSVRDAARTIRLPPARDAGAPSAAPRLHRHEVDLGGIALLLLDSVSMLQPADRGRIVITGSHGGSVSAEFALRHRPRLVVFNDAGGGRHDAGWAALARLDRDGIAAVAVAADSGQIGQPQDMLAHGILSHCNRTSVAMGLHEGGPLAGQLAAFPPDQPGDPSRIQTK